MTTATANLIAREPLPDHEQKKLALGYLHDAWIEATHDGIDGDCIDIVGSGDSDAELEGGAS